MIPNEQDEATDIPITISACAQPSRCLAGSAAEAAFLARATLLGFTVCLPWGNCHRYDNVVEHARRFLRIQVKSATRYAETRYRVPNSGFNGEPYTPEEIDFIAAYIVPENIWYIIPVEATGTRKSLRFYPHTRRPSRGQFEKYREAWCLLTCDPKSRGRSDVPRHCRCESLPACCAVCPRRS